MKPIEAVKAEQRLDYLFGKTPQVSVDAEILAHWARYLCVLTSGYLETSVRAIFKSYAHATADPKVAKYVERCLDDFQSPKMEAILNLAQSFSSDWEEKIRTYAIGQRKDAIDSIVANRHNIAHGRNVGISFATIAQYYKSVKETVDFIGTTCA
jgi:hypothetical protein